MSTVNVHWILFGRPYKITLNIFYQIQISERNYRYFYYYWQTFFAKPLANGLEKPQKIHISSDVAIALWKRTLLMLTLVTICLIF